MLVTTRHRRRFAALAGALVALLTGAAFAVEIDVNGIVDRSVKALGARRYEVREEAEQTLWRLGERARPALAKAAKSSNAEVRLRAGRVLADLDAGLAADWPAELALRARHLTRLPPKERAATVVAVVRRLRGRAARYLAFRLRDDDEVANVALSALASLRDPAALESAAAVLVECRAGAEWVGLALCRSLLQQPAEALEAFSRAGLAGDPRDQHVEAQLRRLRKGLREKRYAEVAKRALERSEQSPGRSEFLYVRAEALGRLGRKKEAGEARAKALAMDPASEAPHAAAARFLMNMNRPAEAKAEWRKVLAARPDHGPVDFEARLGLAALAARRAESAKTTAAAAKAWAEAARHAGKAFDLIPRVRPSRRDGPPLGVLVKALGAAVAQFRRRAAVTALAPTPSDPPPRRAVRVRVQEDFKAALEDMALALTLTEKTFRLDAKPADVRLLDVAPIVVRHNAKTRRLELGLYGEPLGELGPFEPADKKSRFDVRCLDTNYVYELSRATGLARRVARLEREYEARLEPTAWLAELKDVRVRLNGRAYPWSAVLTGVRMDTRPRALRIEIEGRRPSGQWIRTSFEVPVGEPAKAPPMPAEPKPVRDRGPI